MWNILCENEGSAKKGIRSKEKYCGMENRILPELRIKPNKCERNSSVSSSAFGCHCSNVITLIDTENN